MAVAPLQVMRFRRSLSCCSLLLLRSISAMPRAARSVRPGVCRRRLRSVMPVLGSPSIFARASAPASRTPFILRLTHRSFLASAQFAIAMAPSSLTRLKRRFSVSTFFMSPDLQSSFTVASLIWFFSRFSSFKELVAARTGFSKLCTSSGCSGHPFTTNFSNERSPTAPFCWTATATALKDILCHTRKMRMCSMDTRRNSSSAVSILSSTAGTSRSLEGRFSSVPSRGASTVTSARRAVHE
mmetsp:Transcript_22728/g.36551  ORF Transcript_22728/g.36551 Transcript_22728/m.36551 type:complete len:241 (-) Transcript_22728:448-1170(-)